MRVSQRRLLVFVLAVALAAAMLPFPGPGQPPGDVARAGSGAAAPTERVMPSRGVDQARAVPASISIESGY